MPRRKKPDGDRADLAGGQLVIARAQTLRRAGAGTSRRRWRAPDVAPAGTRRAATPHPPSAMAAAADG